MKRTVNRNQRNVVNPRRGFSFVEMIVTLAILALLFSLLSPAVTRSRQSARQLECMTRLRNVDMAMLNVLDTTGRFPASGNFTDTGAFQTLHNWVLDVLPWLDQSATYNAWKLGAPIQDPVNFPLTKLFFPILVCPADISVEQSDDATTYGNLSFVVNGGAGYTTYYQGVHDCPVDLLAQKLDLNGDGVTCPSSGDGAAGDKSIFLMMGLFFNETWTEGVSRRHHTAATVTDGMSNTVVLSENVRTGYNPGTSDPSESSWASPHSVLTSFYIGDPCLLGGCTPGNVNYQRANSEEGAINSGLGLPEGKSPIPNSFHIGGVNMAFGDGRVQFISQRIDGNVYAAIVSPQGAGLSGLLHQTLDGAP